MNHESYIPMSKAQVRRLAFWKFSAVVATVVLVASVAFSVRDTGGLSAADGAQRAAPANPGTRPASDAHPVESEGPRAGMDCRMPSADPNDCVYF